MDWARAKTILIALLLAVDIFLLVTYIGNESSMRNDELAVRSEVCEILGKEGVSIEEELVPLDSAELMPATLQSVSDMKENAERLFGQVTENITADGTEYSGEKGNILVSGDSFSLVYDAEKKVNSEDDAEALAYSVAKKLGAGTKKQQFVTVAENGGYTVTIPQIVSGVSIFGCDITARISSQGSVIAHGRFVAGKDFRIKEEKTLKTSALTMIFFDEVRKKGYENISVTDVSPGYTASAPVNGKIALTPTLKFTFLSDGEKTVYLDMTSGDLVNM